MKKLIMAVLVLALIGVGTGIYMWNKPHEKVEDKKGIAITAVELVGAFADDEVKANTQYLNQAIEVAGVIAEVETNQDGGSMIVLDAGDPMAAVQCTMRDKGAAYAKGDKVTIKGFCSGSGITGVSLTDCVAIK